jgi:hypothetical protein
VPAREAAGDALLGIEGIARHGHAHPAAQLVEPAQIASSGEKYKVA